MLTFVISTYLFFSLAATKMEMFCLIVSPVIFLGLGAVLDYVVQKLKEVIPAKVSPWVIAIVLAYLSYDNLMINKLDRRHCDKNIFWNGLNIDAVIDREVGRILKSPDWLVFNSGGNNAVMFMFYNEARAYGNYPTFAQYSMLKSQGVKMATFSDENIPSFLKQDPQVRKIYIKPLVY
jgi:hypothetical protein